MSPGSSRHADTASRWLTWCSNRDWHRLHQPLAHFAPAGRCFSRRPRASARQTTSTCSRGPAPRCSCSSRSPPGVGRMACWWSPGIARCCSPRKTGRIVEALAGQAALALDRARRFESEQAIVETLQRSVLPVSLPRVDGVQMAARYLPGSVQFDVGGDWFDAISLPDGKLGLVVGDVVGKGVQAAASMSQLRNAIRAFSVERLKPSSTLARLNRLANDVLDTAFATVVYLVLDPANGVCRLASAGHPPPIVAYPDGRIELLEGGRGLPLGTGLRSEVPAGDGRAPGRHGHSPLHRRVGRAPRPIHRRRVRRGRSSTPRVSDGS